MKTFLIDQLPLFRMCPRLSIGTAKPGTKTIANFAHFADDLGKIIFIKTKCQTLRKQKWENKNKRNKTKTKQ